jgi:hypothetical protein
MCITKRGSSKGVGEGGWTVKSEEEERERDD